MHASRRWMGRLGGVAAGLAALALAVAFTPGWFAGQRAPTERETVLYYFAQHVGDPALCDEIGWAAYQSYSVLFGGGGASRWRSDCHERVAQAQHDPWLCRNVRPLLDLDPFSSGYSALACRRRTAAGYRSAIGLPDDLLLRTFARMGYDIDRMGIDGAVPPAIRARDVYRSLEHDAAALARARELLTRTDSPLDAEERALTAQLVAVGSGDADGCDRVPAGLVIATASSAPFRDWCLFTLAVDRQRVEVCARMTPAAAEAGVVAAKAQGVRPGIAEQMGLHAQCIRSQDAPGPRPHYGPQAPADEAQGLRLLQALAVAMPSAQHWPAAERARYLTQYVLALWPDATANPARDAARADLVRRLIAPNTSP